jgi:hypothetical protein
MFRAFAADALNSMAKSALGRNSVLRLPGEGQKGFSVRGTGKR